MAALFAYKNQKRKERIEMVLFAMGLFIGGIFGIAVMCLFQINQPEEHLQEAEERVMK